MNLNSILQAGDNYKLQNHLPDIGKDQITRNIIDGLALPQKRISSIYFYDAVGSRLFEKITRLPEYYPTRTEKKLLKQLSYKLFGKLNHLNIIEIGSGDCSKVSILLESIPRQRLKTICYTPVDVSESAIQESAEKLQLKFPGIEIHGIVADFTQQLHCIPCNGNQFFCFLGSTLGNLSRKQQKHFFIDIGKLMVSGDTLLLGVDMIKPADILEKAYNDSQGVTAAFNRNILNVVNNLIGTDFDPESFDHLAFYNYEKNRIEMHLKANRTMKVSCPAVPYKIRIKKGETIHTENSHKYTDAYIKQLAASAGLETKESFMDENRWFSLIQLTKK